MRNMKSYKEKSNRANENYGFSINLCQCVNIKEFNIPNMNLITKNLFNTRYILIDCTCFELLKVNVGIMQLLKCNSYE